MTIDLLQNKKLILLRISDNGIGFDMKQQRKGIGVANIYSRTAAFNGQAVFVSEPGRGCELTITFSTKDNTLITPSCK